MGYIILLDIHQGKGKAVYHTRQTIGSVPQLQLVVIDIVSFTTLHYAVL